MKETDKPGLVVSFIHTREPALITSIQLLGRVGIGSGGGPIWSDSFERVSLTPTGHGMSGGCFFVVLEQESLALLLKATTSVLSR